MKKIILIGASGCGKTTLAQAINQLPLIYKKTQTVEHICHVLDTPGEYIENRNYYSALIVSSNDSDIVGLVQDATKIETVFPPNFATMFTKPVVGIITKVDCFNKKAKIAEKLLKNAGAQRVFKVSSLTGEGIKEITLFLTN
ncbi:ethanolamine utilization protein EutP [Natronincola peptidivorans]|uniref:Ethanolamine utilization protein EutP n=1 Tax=Natronincola peptidivorans TaxID=426128 RepID=A0A1I0EUG0_9FIRM|nr:EutP/PduV family microcompartment system protein [Natronincola peptidivorans]SET49056.1 ethanolamine utilization protein EutP [Natronincola peptidivorans]